MHWNKLQELLLLPTVCTALSGSCGWCWVISHYRDWINLLAVVWSRDQAFPPWNPPIGILYSPICFTIPIINDPSIPQFILSYWPPPHYFCCCFLHWVENSFQTRNGGWVCPVVVLLLVCILYLSPARRGCPYSQEVVFDLSQRLVKLHAVYSHGRKQTAGVAPSHVL